MAGGGGGGGRGADVVFRMGAEWEGSCEGLATASAGGRIAGAEEEGMGRRMGRGLGVEAVAGLGAEVAGLGAEVARLGAEVAAGPP